MKIKDLENLKDDLIKGIEGLSFVNFLRDPSSLTEIDITENLQTLLDEWGITLLRESFERLSKNQIPDHSGEIKLQGIKAEVRILRDKWGVPHIYASNEDDLLFAQGFVHAQDRLWQMEVNRRSGRGTLSELIGKAALSTDRLIRTLGFNRLGHADVIQTDKNTIRYIQSYVNGVNAYLNSENFKLPIEFIIFRTKPQDWNVEDVLCFGRVMMWQMSHSWYNEIVLAKVVDLVGEKMAKEINWLYPKDNPATLDKEIDIKKIFKNRKKLKKDGGFLTKAMGSNNWVISPKKSETKSALLANDMHLPITIPAIWYQNHLVGGSLELSGVSIAGLPLIMAGHNKHIGWGITLAYTDSEDLFIEKFEKNSKFRYHYKNTTEDALVIPEKIYIRGQEEPHVETVVITRHGPIISDLIDYNEQQVALNSLALKPACMFDGWFIMNKAKNWEDFKKAMSYVEAPQLSIVYSDVKGNIGYWLTGRVPVRKKGDGMIPVPGWTGEYEWIDTVPFEEMPHSYNPSRGYIYTCNHKIVDEKYPHFLGNSWMNGYRAKRLVELLDSKKKISVDDCKDFQLDLFCPPAEDFQKILRKYKTKNKKENEILEIFLEWDCFLTKDSVAGCIYEVFKYLTFRSIVEPKLGKDLTNEIMGMGFHPKLKKSNSLHGFDTVSLINILKNKKSIWLKEAGGFDKVVSNGLTKTRKYLTKHISKNIDEWEWGKIHQATFPHALGAKKPLDKIFNRGPYPVGGDTDTLCQLGMHAEPAFEMKASAPSIRFILDMKNFDNCLINVPPGNSGILGSDNYDDRIDSLLHGKYHRMLWSFKDVEENCVNELKFKPKKST